MIKKKLWFSLPLIAFMLGACSIDHDGKNIVGDNLLIDKGTFIPEVNASKAQIQAGLDKQGRGKKALMGLKAYKISYMTTDIDGKPVKASGLITIPALTPAFMIGYKAKTGKDFSLSMVSEQHGTIFADKNAPSVKAEATHQPDPLATAFSAVGAFMTIQPDYLGYGDSEDYHPFLLEDPLANTTIDMIKAAITFANKAGLPINGQLFLSGYSEGGYATLAAAKKIQAKHPELHLMAVAPIAGPYDLEKMAIGTLSQEKMAFPPFLGYLVESYTSTYDNLEIKTILQEKYAKMSEGEKSLYDGSKNAKELYKILPNPANGGQNTDKLFIPEFSATLVRDSNQSFRKHLSQNSVIDWKPAMPVHLYHCGNDKIVPFAMSTLAHQSFTKKGSKTTDVVRIDTVPDSQNPTAVHSNCAPVAYEQVIPWFDKIRKGEK